jgi:Domain of unknown function (DUF4440)
MHEPAGVEDTSTAVDPLRSLNATFIRNFVTNDVAGHDAILHRDFVCISADGERVDRATYLERWASGFDPDVIPYWDTRDEFISVVGDTALVRSTNKHVIVRDGVAQTGMTSYTDTYVRVGSTWRCVQAQLTPLEESHWPADETIVSVYRGGLLEA